jgi:hypothetical protein
VGLYDADFCLVEVADDESHLVHVVAQYGIDAEKVVEFPYGTDELRHASSFVRVVVNATPLQKGWRVGADVVVVV